MYGHWYVVANQKQVNVFTQIKDEDESNNQLKNKYGNKLQLIKKFDNPIPEEASSVPFAKEVINYLDKQQQIKSFTSLAVIAEPRFLGKIKAQMKPQLISVVTNWIKKDLHKIPLGHLADHLPLPNSKANSKLNTMPLKN